MVQRRKLQKNIFLSAIAFFAVFAITDFAFAAPTFDFTGSWTVSWTETSTTCQGYTPQSGTSFLSAQQTGTSWSATDENNESFSGTVDFEAYFGSGTSPSGNIGTETGIVRKDTSLSFTLVRADHGNGTATESMFDAQGTFPICQISSTFILNRNATTTTAASTVNNPQVLRTTTTNIVNLISKRIRNTIGHIGRQMMTDSSPVASDIASVTTSSNSEYGISSKNDIANQFKAVQMDISNTNLGLSAGSSDQRMGVWGNIALTFSDNDLAATASDIDIKTYIAGFDYRISEKVVTGFAISYDNTDATNTYNAGELDADSYSLVPYISFLINDYLSVEALYGHSWVDTDQVRNSTVSSSPTSRKDFVSSSLNAYKTFNNLNLMGNMTYTWAKEVTEGFNEVDSATGTITTVASQRTKFSQFALGLELSYLINQFEPYASLTYENDVTHTDIAGVAYDNEGGNFGLGVRMALMDSLSGDLDYNQTINRDNLDEYTVSANVRYDF